MNFKEGQPIYIQIAERLSGEILSGVYGPDERVPGVREYSALFEVNVNTTVKAYDQLARKGVLYTRRGLGYFVAAEARQLLHDEQRSEFVNTYLPDLFAQMDRLGIPIDEVTRRWDEYRTLLKEKA